MVTGVRLQGRQGPAVGRLCRERAQRGQNKVAEPEAHRGWVESGVMQGDRVFVVEMEYANLGAGDCPQRPQGDL